MVTRFALSVFTVLIWIVQVSADEIKAKTMAEALEKISCEHVHKGDDGLWSSTDAIEVPNDRSEHPRISDPKYTAILQRRCRRLRQMTARLRPPFWSGEKAMRSQRRRMPAILAAPLAGMAVWATTGTATQHQARRIH